MPSLKWVAAEGPPRVFPILRRITSIGHAGGNDVQIEDGSLADYHAQIVFDGRDFGLSEVDPDGEILLNGKKKRRSRIVHGDRLRLGQVDLVFQLFDEQPTQPEASGEDPGHCRMEGMVQLSEFNRRLMQIRSVSEQLEALIDAVIEISSATKGFVLLLRDGEPEITVARNMRQQNLPDAVHHLSDSILRKVIDSGQPLVVRDAVHDEMFRGSESIMNLKLSSVMCAPLIVQGQLLGLIYVGNDRVVNLFDEASLNMFTVLSGQAALILHSALVLDALETDRKSLSKKLEDMRFGDLIGACPSLLDVFGKIKRVAATDISVLITGETGTGKELIAREIHRRSNRADKPFIVVNCGAIPENLIESELFGHVRGAFTGAVATREGKFQLANGGTLFLDEIGELPVALQVKLLRALQERVVMKVGGSKAESVDIRVIAATHRNLAEDIEQGSFREDLYYRLNVVNLHLPPLRERGEDVVVLAKYLLGKYVVEYGSRVKGFTPNAVVAMKKYEWPGNVRQLENRIKKAVVLAERPLIGADDLDLFPEALAPIVPLVQAREDFQRRYILEVLERNGGNRSKTARDLGVDPRTIFRYLEREGADPGESAGP